MPKKCVLLLVAAAALSLNVAARSPDEVRAQCRAEGRPCVGLVLSGGGARGFAHVGVLEDGRHGGRSVCGGILRR